MIPTKTNKNLFAKKNNQKKTKHHQFLKKQEKKYLTKTSQQR